jgi:hypothetical protein
MKVWIFIACVLLLVAPAMVAQAATQPSVKVNRCDPVHNPGSAGTTYVGYSPGYYPSGRYYWNDPYRRSYYEPPVSPTGRLYIDFVNTSTDVMSAIDFGLIARGSLIAEVRDVGKFSPGAEIKHEFGVSPNIFPIGTSMPACMPLRIEFQNGTTWTNPKLPPSDKMLYGGH